MLIKSVFPAICLLTIPVGTNSQSQIKRGHQVTTDQFHARALQQGNVHDVIKLPESWALADDLQSLTIDNSVIVVVDVLSNRCELADDGSAIYTRYQAKVAEVLSDDLTSGVGNPRDKTDQISAGRALVKQGAVIPISLAGGKVGFGDGTEAQVDVMNLPRLTNNHRYLLYLQYSPGLRSFLPAQLGRSMFEINPDGATLRWMALTASDKGLQRHNEVFKETLQDARINASSKPRNGEAR